MGLEAATFINQLVATNPVGATDPRSQGDDHLRLIKLALQNTLPALTGAVTSTHTELSQLHGGVLASIGNGTLGAPAYSFASDTDLGVYRVGANEGGLASGGVRAFRWNATSVISDVAHRFSDGAVGTPSMTFDLNPNLGFYRQGASDFRAVVGGSAVQIWDASAVYFRSQAVGVNGTAGNPTFSFESDFNTGMYRFGADDIGLSAGGALQFAIGTTRSTAIQIFGIADGAIGTPGLYFNADPNTGVWRSGADTMSLVAGGVAVLTVNGGNVVLGNSLGYVLDLGAIGIAATATTGGAGAPPAQVAGYAVMALTGTLRKFPYYNM